MRKTTPLKDRFDVKMSEQRTARGCLLWRGATQINGYGKLWNGHGGLILAHRAAWELVNGPVPPGKLVLHKCDVRLCCAVDHLYVGTHADNHADALRRGRRDHARVLRGADHPLAKLTEAKVRRLRRWSAAGVLGTDIAKRLGVSNGSIYAILAGRSWTHVKEAYK